MKITVLIHRQLKTEVAAGTLKAWVTQNGWKGAQMLRGGVKEIDTAIQEIDTAVMKCFKLIEPPEISYQIDDYLDLKKKEGSAGENSAPSESNDRKRFPA